MGKIIFFSVFSVALLIIIAVGGSYLIVYWRDTRRRWRIENEQDERRRLQESFQDITILKEEIRTPKNFELKAKSAINFSFNDPIKSASTRDALFSF